MLQVKRLAEQCLLPVFLPRDMWVAIISFVRLDKDRTSTATVCKEFLSIIRDVIGLSRVYLTLDNVHTINKCPGILRNSCILRLTSAQASSGIVVFYCHVKIKSAANAIGNARMAPHTILNKFSRLRSLEGRKEGVF